MHRIRRGCGLFNLIIPKSSIKSYCSIIIYYHTVNFRRNIINKNLFPFCNLEHENKQHFSSMILRNIDDQYSALSRVQHALILWKMGKQFDISSLFSCCLKCLTLFKDVFYLSRYHLHTVYFRIG